MKKILIPLVVLLAFLGISLAGSYNNLITLNQNMEQQWAQVETQYQRRFDLIPNLVNSVQGFMKQERQVFEDIAEARTRYSSAPTVTEKSEAASDIESSFGRLLVIMENYPELKSNETVNRLMDELAGTENRIAVERGRYNDTVTQYNLLVKRFPGNILAGLFGFSAQSFFESSPQADVAPQVDLNLE